MVWVLKKRKPGVTHVCLNLLQKKFSNQRKNDLVWPGMMISGSGFFLAENVNVFVLAGKLPRIKPL